MSEPLLKLNSLTKTYNAKSGREVKALKGVNLSFDNRGLVFVLGKSGSGKTTLLNLIGGLDSPTSGEIVIKGKSSRAFKGKDYDSYRNTYLGFVFQEYFLLQDYTVYKNIALALELQGKRVEPEKIKKALSEVELDGYENRKVSELSGGQKQRVAVARALIKDPEIILADEPTGALDSETGKQIFELLKKLSKNRLVIIVSHDREDALKFGDRIIEFKDGEVLSDENFASQTKAYDAGSQLMGDSPFHVIKSKFPTKHAFSMGVKTLTKKPFRLIATLLLCIFSLSAFGLALVFYSYNEIDATKSGLYQNEDRIFSFQKQMTNKTGTVYYTTFAMSEAEAASIENKFSDVKFTKMHSFLTDFRYAQSISNGQSGKRFINTFFKLNSAVELTDDFIAQYDFDLLGAMPTTKNEIVITKHDAIEFTFEGNEFYEINNYNAQNKTKVEIKTVNDLLNKNLFINDDYYKIVGILDTKLNDEKYITSENGRQTGLFDVGLGYEYSYIMTSTFHNAVFVNNAFITDLKSQSVVDGFVNVNTLRDTYWYTQTGITEEAYTGYSVDYIAKYDDRYDAKIYYFNESAPNFDKTLRDNEIIINGSILGRIYPDATINQEGVEEFINNGNPFEFKIHKALLTNEKEEASLLTFTVKGVYFDSSDNYDESKIILSSETFDKHTREDGDIIAVCALAPKNLSLIGKLVDFSYEETDGFRYFIASSATPSFAFYSETIQSISSYFLIAAIVLAVFAVIMLFNFISISVSSRWKDMGILRALGAKPRDILKIFLSENIIIVLTELVFSILVAIVGCNYLNSLFIANNVLIPIFNISFLQPAVIIVIAIFTLIIATFLPIFKIMRLKPIEIINKQ